LGEREREREREAAWARDRTAAGCAGFEKPSAIQARAIKPMKGETINDHNNNTKNDDDDDDDDDDNNNNNNTRDIYDQCCC
jgi:hypothetical protein